MRSAYNLKFIMIIFLGFCALFLFADNANAAEGVAVTGSFSAYEYTVVQGETIDTPLLNVIFFNNYSHDVTLQLWHETPEGIDIPLEDDYIALEANSRLDIPIVITTNANALPGEYDIFLKATLIDSAIDGKTNVGSEYILKSKVTVVNQYADININIIDASGEKLQSSITLYQITDELKSPIVYSQSDMLNAKIPPGDYEIATFWDNYHIVNHRFTAGVNESITQSLTAETILIYDYKISSVFVANNKTNLQGINVNCSLQNIYQDLNNVRAALLVYKDDVLFEQRDIAAFDALSTNKQDINYLYVPEKGFEEANYEFKLEVYAGANSALYASSLPASLNVTAYKSNFVEYFEDTRVILFIFIICAIVGAFFLIRFVVGKIKEDEEDSPAPAMETPPEQVLLQETPDPKPAGICPDCGAEDEIECPVCNGKGKTMYGNISEECIYCNGAGIVLCAACVESKHLRVCPRCNGDGYVINKDKKTECTFCNGLGHVLTRENEKYIGEIKMKLGKKVVKKGDNPD